MTTTKTAGIGVIVALVIGSVVFGFIGMSDRNFANNCQTTPGQVTEVVKRTKTERDRNSKTYRTKKKTTYRVSFTYTVDGKEYNESDSMSHSVEVGPATVYYVPSDPDNGKLEKPSWVVDFLMAIGMLIGAGVVAFKTLIGKSS